MCLFKIRLQCLINCVDKPSWGFLVPYCNKKILSFWATLISHFGVYDGRFLVDFPLLDPHRKIVNFSMPN